MKMSALQNLYHACLTKVKGTQIILVDVSEDMNENHFVICHVHIHAQLIKIVFCFLCVIGHDDFLFIGTASLVN